MVGQKARSFLKSKGVNVQAELKSIEYLIDVEWFVLNLTITL